MGRGKIFDPARSFEGAAGEFLKLGERGSSGKPSFLPLLRVVASGLFHPIKMRQYISDSAIVVQSPEPNAKERSARLELIEHAVFAIISGAYLFGIFSTPGLPENPGVLDVFKFEILISVALMAYAILGGIGAVPIVLRGKLAFGKEGVGDPENQKVVILDAFRCILKYLPAVLLAATPLILASGALMFRFAAESFSGADSPYFSEEFLVNTWNWLARAMVSTGEGVRSTLGIAALIPSVVLSFSLGGSLVRLEERASK